MYSPPSTPSWAKGDGIGSSASSKESNKPKTFATGKVYPHEKYKQSPVHTPNPSWGLRSYQAPSVFNSDSEYPVRINARIPDRPAPAFLDIDRDYASTPIDTTLGAEANGPSDATKNTKVSAETRAQLRQPDMRGSHFEIPDIPLKIHEESDVFLREKREAEKYLDKDDVYLQSGKGLPYSTIYKLKRALPDPRSPTFIPGAAVDISVIDVLNTDLMGRTSKTHTYAIKVCNGEYEWIVRKTFDDWRQLHGALKGLQKRLAGEFPQILPGFTAKTDVDKAELPRFPTTEDDSVPAAELPGRMHGFTKYLRYLVGNGTCRDHVAVRSFLEISPFSLVHGLGAKMKEGYVMQRIADVPVKPFPISMICGNMADGAKWLERWLVVKESCLILVDPFDASVKDVMLADATLEVDGGLFESGVPRGIAVKQSTRRLILQCHTEKDVSEFVMELTFMKHVTARDYSGSNLHGSFAPLRENCYVKWLVDGKAYFKAVADAMEAAKEELFICGWW
ncbi:putative Phospholipase D1 [Hypsibius exemplaris]|uniref:Phospholipase D1 n=1 Tax=Hypsibius exemplaris TaxID=2072580 RepID=A0A9X6NA80_HYPEX|nr:putative Phospholipase D1 [Hypsibius exemplaris]